MQSVPITTKVVSLNPAHDDVYWIQHYVITFVSDRHNITEILLKVALNTIIDFTSLLHLRTLPTALDVNKENIM
jgi:hypothetical protein